MWLFWKPKEFFLDRDALFANFPSRKLWAKNSKTPGEHKIGGSFPTFSDFGWLYPHLLFKPIAKLNTKRGFWSPKSCCVHWHTLFLNLMKCTTSKFRLKGCKMQFIDWSRWPEPMGWRWTKSTGSRWPKPTGLRWTSPSGSRWKKPNGVPLHFNETKSSSCTETSYKGQIAL